MIMSFAVPLGVGMESLGDYFDLEMAEDMPTAEIAARLEGQMAEGMHIVSVRKVEDGKRVKRWRWWQQQIILWSSVRAKSFYRLERTSEGISGTAGDQSDQAD